MRDVSSAIGAFVGSLLIGSCYAKKVPFLPFQFLNLAVLVPFDLDLPFTLFDLGCRRSRVGSE